MKEISNQILNKKCFIFDIDGTLVDSMEMWNMVDQQLIFKYTNTIVDLNEIKSFRDRIIYNCSNIHGDIYEIYTTELIKNFNVNISAEQFFSERQEISEHISTNDLNYKEGAGEFLQILKHLDKKLGVATTTSRRHYEIYQKKNQKMQKIAPLDKLIDEYVVCEDVQKKKPDPEAYLLVVQKLKCKPEECIVFEDSINGVIAAKEAGLEVVAVYDESAKYEQDLISKIADYKIPSFANLIQTLEIDKIQNQPS